MGETVREVLERRLESVLDDFEPSIMISVIVMGRLVRELADEACSALGISDKEQGECWDSSEESDEEKNS